MFKSFDSDGNVTYFPELQKSGNAKFLVPVVRQPELTFYTRFGNVFVLLCGIIFVCGGGVALSRAVLFSRAVIDPVQAERERIRTAFLRSGEAGEEKRK